MNAKTKTVMCSACPRKLMELEMATAILPMDIKCPSCGNSTHIDSKGLANKPLRG